MEIDKQLIPRKYRRSVISLIEMFSRQIGEYDDKFRTWDDFLKFRLIGAEDGWLLVGNKEHQALLWLVGIGDIVTRLKEIRRGE